MTRTMIDCIHANVPAVHSRFKNAEMVAWYSTGSPGIQWTAADRALWPNANMVEIDQGGSGSPRPGAMVRDVEPGAWAASDAVTRLPWTAARKTIYCDRSRAEEVANLGWKGDVWLAWPGWSDTVAPKIGSLHIVAVQNVFGADYDSSIVLDDSWPGVHTPPVPSPAMTLTVLERTGSLAFAVHPEADHYVIKYRANITSAGTVIARSPQPIVGSVTHLAPLTIPGSHGGNVDVFAIVHSKPVLVGSVALP